MFNYQWLPLTSIKQIPLVWVLYSVLVSAFFLLSLSKALTRTRNRITFYHLYPLIKPINKKNIISETMMLPSRMWIASK